MKLSKAVTTLIENNGRNAQNCVISLIEAIRARGRSLARGAIRTRKLGDSRSFDGMASPPPLPADMPYWQQAAP